MHSFILCSSKIVRFLLFLLCSFSLYLCLYCPVVKIVRKSATTSQTQEKILKSQAWKMARVGFFQPWDFSLITVQKQVILNIVGDFGYFTTLWTFCAKSSRFENQHFTGLRIFRGVKWPFPRPVFYEYACMCEIKRTSELIAFKKCSPDSLSNLLI